mgnify:CR=1 FL=1
MASALETNFNYTYPGILTTEVFFKPVEDSPALADLAVIDQGISYKKQYNVLPQLSKILKPYDGCARSFSGSQDVTNKTLEVKEFELGLEWCKDDFTNYLTSSYNYLAQEMLKSGIDSFDPSGTPVASMISKLIDEALRQDVFRRICFGDTASASADFNTIDGIWTQLVDNSGTASTYCVRRASGTSLGTSDLAANEAIDVLEKVYAQSSNLLKAIPTNRKKMFVTGSIFDNYVNSLVGYGAVTEQAYTAQIKGIPSITFKGIEIVPVRIWDSMLADSDNPLNATTRHLVLYTTKENHIIGVENSADLNKVNGWYDRKDRKYYFEGDMKMGYTYLHCDLQTIAY